MPQQVHDLGQSFANKNVALFAPYKVTTWSDIADSAKDANGNPTVPALPADTRPRLTVPATATQAASSILPQPQYAKDRFRDDFNPPALHAASGAVTLLAVGASLWRAMYKYDVVPPEHLLALVWTSLLIRPLQGLLVVVRLAAEVPVLALVLAFSETLGKGAQTLALSHKGEMADNVTHSLHDSVFEDVLQGKPLMLASGARQQYPQDSVVSVSTQSHLSVIKLGIVGMTLVPVHAHGHDGFVETSGEEIVG